MIYEKKIRLVLMGYDKIVSTYIPQSTVYLFDIYI